MILTAVFAKDVGLVYGETKTFLYHLLALVIVLTFSFFGSLLLYKVSSIAGPLRASEEEEKIGLDLSMHGETI